MNIRRGGVEERAARALPLRRARRRLRRLGTAEGQIQQENKASWLEGGESRNGRSSYAHSQDAKQQRANHVADTKREKVSKRERGAYGSLERLRLDVRVTFGGPPAGSAALAAAAAPVVAVADDAASPAAGATEPAAGEAAAAAAAAARLASCHANARRHQRAGAKAQSARRMGRTELRKMPGDMND